MDLKTFVAETLQQIIDGVREAQENQKGGSPEGKGAAINPGSKFQTSETGHTTPPRPIEFDVAVTVTEGSEKKGKGSLGVANYVGIGGEKSASNSNSTVIVSPKSEVKPHAPACRGGTESGRMDRITWSNAFELGPT